MVPEINLLPKLDRKSTSKKLFFAISGIVFALALTFVVVQYVTVLKTVDKLQADKQMIEQQKITLESEVASLQVPEVADLATTVRFIESVAYPVTPLLAEIQRYIPENTYIRSYAFGGNTIVFDVDFETIAHVATYIGDLDGSVYFIDVKVDSISTFNPTNRDVEEETANFDEIERFANTITVTIDPMYLQNRGVVE